METQLDESVLKLWEGYRDTFVRDRILSCARALSERDFAVVAAPTVPEANRAVVNQVKRSGTVFYWGETTLEEMGIVTTLSARGNRVENVLPAWKSGRLPGRRALRKPGISSRDTYLTTPCAITIDGVVIKPEPEGLPVFSPGFRPGLIVVVAGFNKIVDDLDEGLRRSRDVCIPGDARHLGLDLACATAEHCVQCDEPSFMCAVSTVVTRKPRDPDMVIVLVGERLGY